MNKGVPVERSRRAHGFEVGDGDGGEVAVEANDEAAQGDRGGAEGGVSTFGAEEGGAEGKVHEDAVSDGGVRWWWW